MHNSLISEIRKADTHLKGSIRNLDIEKADVHLVNFPVRLFFPVNNKYFFVFDGNSVCD